MGKDKKTKRKHRSQLSKSPSKKLLDQSSDDDGSSASSTKTDFVMGKLKSIGSYVNDRAEMVNQMFDTLQRGDHLYTVMPDILKGLPLVDLKQMCVDELEGMSKKRIRCILAGEDMTSSSGTEDSSSEDEVQEEIVASSTAYPSTISPYKAPANALDDQDDHQQPDSTIADPDVQLHVDNQPESPQHSNNDDFGLQEPAVNIILEESSRSNSSIPSEHYVEVNLNNSDDESVQTDPDGISTKTGTTHSEANDQHSNACGIDPNSEGDIGTPPPRELQQPVSPAAFEMEPNNVDAVESESHNHNSDESMAASNCPAANSRYIDHLQQSDTLSEPGEDPDQEELLYEGDDNATSEIDAEIGDYQETIEFVDEPVSTNSSKRIRPDPNSGEDFSWRLRVQAKPSTVDNDEPPRTSTTQEIESQEKDSIMEPHDDALSQGSDSIPQGELLPPGFEPRKSEPPRASAASSSVTAKDATSGSTSSTKAASTLPIRTLYNQLKQHHMAITVKQRQSKSKIFGPRHWENQRQEQDQRKPAGPALPPDSASSEAITQPIPTVEKKAKKIKKKSDVLTPEFLAELERKKLEHERDMKGKMELLEELKTRRQTLTSREREIEEDLKKQLELRLFEIRNIERKAEEHRTIQLEEVVQSDEHISNSSGGEDSDISESEILMVDVAEDKQRHVDVDDDVLSIPNDDGKLMKDIETDQNVNKKFPSFTVSVRASASGELVRNVVEKGNSPKEAVGVRSQRHIELRSSICVAQKRPRSRTTSETSQSGHAERIRHKSYHERHRSSRTESYRQRYHASSSHRSDRRSPEYKHRYSRISERRRSPDRRSPYRRRSPSVERTVRIEPAPTAPPEPPVVDDAFRQQCELLELELRAKAIRSLMKAQDEQDKNEDIII